MRTLWTVRDVHADTPIRRRSLMASFLLLFVAIGLPSAASATDEVPGDLDTSFGGDGWVATEEEDWGWKSAMLIQPDGKIVVAGSYRHQVEVWRFLNSGELDASFGGSGRVIIDLPGREGGAVAAALQPDGKIVVAGHAGLSLGVARFLPDGSLDPGFGEGDGISTIRIPRMRAQAHAIDVLADGRILIGGQVARQRLDRWGFERVVGMTLTLLTSAGSPDATFGSAGTVRAPFVFGDLSVDARGILVMGVDRKRANRVVLARYTTVGLPDASFAPGGRVGRSLGKRITLYDGEVVTDALGRTVVSITGESRRCFFGYGALLRFNVDGSWDTSFSADGVALRGCRALPDVTIQQDGRIVVAGEVFAGAGSGEYRPILARVAPDGTPDATFGTEGVVMSTPDSEFDYWAATADVVIQADGKIVLLVGAIWLQSFALGRFLAA